jgi:hypothetical protein
MKPEIRAAVKTLAAAFKVIVEALAEEEPRQAPPAMTPVAPPTPPPVPPLAPTLAKGHAAHLVLSRYGGLDMCCDRHSEEFEANVRRCGHPPGAMDHMPPAQREYIQERLGGPR